MIISAAVQQSDSLTHVRTTITPTSSDEKTEAQADFLLCWKSQGSHGPGGTLWGQESELRASTVHLACATLQTNCRRAEQSTEISNHSTSSVKHNCTGITALKTDSFLSFKVRGDTQRKNSRLNYRNTHALPSGLQWTLPLICVQQPLVHLVCVCQDCLSTHALPAGQNDHGWGRQPGLPPAAVVTAPGGVWHVSPGRGSFHLHCELLRSQKPGAIKNHPLWKKLAREYNPHKQSWGHVDQNMPRPGQPRVFQLWEAQLYFGLKSDLYNQQPKRHNYC